MTNCYARAFRRGGFLLLYWERGKQAGSRAGTGLKEMRFAFDPQGSATRYMEEDNGEQA